MEDTGQIYFTSIGLNHFLISDDFETIVFTTD